MLIFSFVYLSACKKPDGASGSLPQKPDDIYRNVYEIFVASFYDSNGDGMGDLRGVTQKLDYIADEETGLGADAIWMMPIMPSPSYHKYDVTDYLNVDPAYGTLSDFDELIAACHDRGVTVIIDLVLNHTSVQHPWFITAKQEIRNQLPFDYFNFYNFVNNKISSAYYEVPGRYYYEALFWDGMPDLNYDNYDVRDAVMEIVSFWLDRGVDGFRLDAAKHIYNREKDNIAFWTWFTTACRAIKPDIYLVAEVWDNDAVLVPYYQTGLDSLFNFGFAGATGQIAASINSGRGSDLAKRIENYDTVIKKQNEHAVNAPFLSNHDTDRSQGFFGGDEEKMKLAAAVYLLIPGNSYIYYGEEIGLTGKGIDENKRAAFVWSIVETAGQTKGPQGMTERPNMREGAMEQLLRPGSLLNRYRELIALKNKYPAIARGVPAAVNTGEKSICAYTITYGSECLLIAHNFSKDEITVVFEETGISKSQLAGVFLPNKNTVCAWANGKLTLPGYGTAVITD
jgi:glycosidase